MGGAAKMKSIIKRCNMAINSHVVRKGNVAFAIFTGYSEGYKAMVQGRISNRVVRFENALNWSDDEIMDYASSLYEGKRKGIKVIRKGYKVQ